jgi:hypothetical protein
MGTVDGSPVRSPRELAAASDLVVEGMLVGVGPGPGIGPPSRAITTAVWTIAVDEVLHGSLPDGVRRVYVELLALGGPRSIEDARHALGSGARVLAYLVSTPIRGTDLPAVEPDAGRPRGERLWTVTGLEGFVLADERGRVAQPLVASQVTEEPLEEHRPDRAAWPDPPITERG